jgi:hypothetical protein
VNKFASAERRSQNLLPSIADVIFLGVLFFLTLGGDQRLLGDADTGYHVRAGEFIIDNLRIPQTDIFSFLTPSMPWTLHEWLSEVIMALVHRGAGLTGVVVLFALMIALSCYLVLRWLLEQQGNILFAAVGTLLVALSSSSNWLARPHIFTFVLFVTWYHLLNNYQYRDRNDLFVMPPIMLVWVNLHGGFILGLMLLGIYLLGNFTRFCFAANHEKPQWRKKTRLLAMITTACALAALLNPYGYKTLIFPFRVVQDKFLMDHISEYLSPNFHFSSVVPFEIMLLTTIGVLAISRARLDLIELTLILLFGHMALFSARHMPLFAIVAGPIVLKQAQIAFDQTHGRLIAALKQRIDNIAQIDQSTTRYAWPVVGALGVLIFAQFGALQHNFNAEHVPVQAVEFLNKEHVAGNMFNNDEFGDYIIYAAWPKYKVFIDGRTDMYGAARVKEYLKISQAASGWESVAEKYQITWVLHDRNSALSKVLLERKDWRLIYSDSIANIFVKAVPQYDEIAKKYHGIKPFARENGYTN